MNFSKFAVSTALLSGVAYLLAFTGVTPIVLLFIFVLFADLEVSVKKNVSQALLLNLFFSVTSVLLVTLSSWYLKLVGADLIMENAYSIYKILASLNIFSWLNGFLGLCEFVVLVLAFFTVVKGKDLKIPVITKFVDNHFEGNTSAE